MYIMCVILRLTSTLSRRAGALQISIIIIIYYSLSLLFAIVHDGHHHAVSPHTENTTNR